MNNGWGLFNILNLPLYLEVFCAFILLDFGIWLQHVLFHKVKFLWRFHKIHHSDEEVDFTTGVRFHPGEIIISMLYKILLVFLIGPTIGILIIFEVILNASSIFVIGNSCETTSIKGYLFFVLNRKSIALGNIQGS